MSFALGSFEKYPTPLLATGFPIRIAVHSLCNIIFVPEYSCSLAERLRTVRARNFVFGYIYFEGCCDLFRLPFIVRAVKNSRKLRWVECVQSDSKLLSEFQ